VLAPEKDAYAVILSVTMDLFASLRMTTYTYSELKAAFRNSN
jgi:hypothetical protein